MTIPLLCVFLAFLLIWFPRVLVIVAILKSGERFDNNHPRDQQARLEGWGKRAQAAHNNAFESFAPFAASVIVAHLAGANPDHAAALAITHVIARTLYPLAYIANLSSLRSSIWGIGTLATTGLFILGYLKLGYFLSLLSRAWGRELVTIEDHEVPAMHAIPTATKKNPTALAPNRAIGLRPLRVVLYGVEGVGKSTFASQAPDPIFLCAEEGAVGLDVARFPTAHTWIEVLEAIRVLTHEEHPYKTLVIDSLDWLE
ncbi:MAG: MAPEG family protein, partial [Myxococcales bacterium]|nr:MAPEG family protein [Polyangiaceae bacterium]MDW8251168.1 MAPEG family protein [Myxococcales bacterium]